MHQVFIYFHLKYLVYIKFLVNCIDRHVEANPNKTAIIWEKDEPGQVEKLTYK